MKDQTIWYGHYDPMCKEKVISLLIVIPFVAGFQHLIQCIGLYFSNGSGFHFFFGVLPTPQLLGMIHIWHYIKFLWSTNIHSMRRVAASAFGYVSCLHIRHSHGTSNKCPKRIMFSLCFNTIHLLLGTPQAQLQWEWTSISDCFVMSVVRVRHYAS
jgi:hypothetical protein